MINFNKIKLDRVLNSEANLDLYRTGMHALIQSGIIDFMKSVGFPTMVDNGKDQAVMAAQAARASGWNDCLDTLLEFQQIYIVNQTPQEHIRMDFSSSEISELRGDLTKEEADAIRRDKSPKYDISKYTNNIPEPGTRPS